MTTVFTLAGAFGTPSQIPAMLGGEVTNGNTVTPIFYPNWTIFEAQVDQGAEMLNNAVTTTTGPMIAMGHSLGAVVCCNWLRNYGPSSTVSPADLSFVLMGNSVRPNGGFCFDLNYYPNSPAPANTPYTVTDIARQYDGWADWPQNSGVLIADWNAWSGMNNVHPDYRGVRLTDPKNVSYVAGNITYIWSPTWPAPILGTSQVGTAVFDQDIRPQIEAAYSRPVTIPNPTY